MKYNIVWHDIIYYRAVVIIYYNVYGDEYLKIEINGLYLLAFWHSDVTLWIHRTTIFNNIILYCFNSVLYYI